MIGLPGRNVEYNDLTRKVEQMLPSLFPRVELSPEGKPYVYPYTCHRHEVSGNSPTAYPRLCWFGGEQVDATPQAQSQVRGAPRR